MEESLERGWNDHEFSLGQVGFKVPVGHPSGDVEQASGCTSWEHRGVVWVKVQIIIRATAGDTGFSISRSGGLVFPSLLSPALAGRFFTTCHLNASVKKNQTNKNGNKTKKCGQPNVC